MLVIESLKISSKENNDESRDLIESGGCLMINGGWLESISMILFDCFLFDKGDQ